MDQNLRKTIQEYREKQKNSGAAIDCVELEKCLREFKTELYIKRDEVNQLRTELDAANLEIQNLRKCLDATKRSLEENQFNLSFQLKKSRNTEEELHEKRDSLMKINLQHKMTVAEIDIMKQKLQKAEMEKVELSRKVDVYESKQRHNSMYHNEILKRDNHLRNFVEKINEMMTKLQTEHLQAMELSKEIHLASESVEKFKLCAIDNEKLRKEKEKFEEMYIKVNAKYEKLEELLAMDSSVTTPNLFTKIIFNQWKLHRSHYEVQIKQRDEILNKISESLANEKIINCKLIQDNENIKVANKKLQEENDQLTKIYKGNSDNIKVLNEKIKLLEENQPTNEINKTMDLSANEVKEEPIEIDDD